MENLNDKRAVDRREKNIASRVIFLAMLLLFAFYVNLRWANESPVFEKAKSTADTPAYVRISGEAVFSRGLWTKARPPIFPLLLKVYDADAVKVTAFQTAFSIFAWGLLAFSLAHSFHTLLRLPAFGLILALSLDRHIAGWDLVLLTESLSVSLMVIFLAAWLWLLRGWSWAKVALLASVALAWGFTRDTNSWLLLMAAGLILLTVLFFRAQKRYLFIAILFILFFALSNFTADTAQRWVFPFQNVLAQRILPDQGAVAFFEACGMPVTPELLARAGGFANSGNRAFYKEPALESYRGWLHANGKGCYMRWLISRPLTSLREPWADFAWLLAFEEVDFFFPQSFEPVLPWYVEQVLFPQDFLIGLWTAITVAALIAIWRKAWKQNHAWIVFIALSLLIYPHLFIVWHGDVAGTHRHALTVSVQFVLSLWMLVLLVVESVLARFRLPDSV